MKLLFATLIACGLSGTAFAQDLVYEPVNPSFGGNPFNSAHLLAIANAQNDFERPQAETSASSDLDRFVRSLQSRLLSSLSTQVANAIFGEDAQDEGTIVFGDQTISFVRGLDGIELTITEADGSVTVITIPTFQTTDDADPDEDPDAKSSALVLSKPPDLSTQSQFLDVSGELTFGTSLSETSLQPISQPIQ